MGVLEYVPYVSQTGISRAPFRANEVVETFFHWMYLIN